jgi:hypothetical protein
VRVAAVLALASMASIVLLFPYLLALVPKLHHVPVPLWVLVAAQAAQGGLLAFGLGWLGLTMGAAVGLDSPLVRAWVERLPRPVDQLRFLPISAAAGLLTGAGLTALDWLAFWSRQPQALRDQALAPSLWAGFLASFYGGFGEELLTRLFLVTLLVWIPFKLTGKLTPAMFVTAIVVGALAFAAGHLPTAAQLAPLTEPVVLRVLVLNGVAGIVFGILYWKKGLEQAMVAHFCADLVLHVAAPALVR